MANKKLGTVLNIPLFKDEDGDTYLDVSGLEKVWLTNHYVPEYTIENFVAEYTALTNDPRERVIAAARALVGVDGFELEDGDDATQPWADLMDAVEALENADDDDEE